MTHLASRRMLTIPIRRRLDHGPMYMCVTIGLFFGAIYIVAHWNTQTPMFSWLTLGTERLMGTVQLLSTGGCIFGMLKGTRFLTPGADLRDLYSIGKWSILPLLIAYGTFEIGVIMTGAIVPWSEANLLFAMVAVGYVIVAAEFHVETLRLNKELRRSLGVTSGYQEFD